MFSDSVLCLGKILQHPEYNETWKNRVAWVRAEKNYNDFDAVIGESTEFEWNIFPGFTTLQLCDKISDLLNSVGHTSESFTRRNLNYVHVQLHFLWQIRQQRWPWTSLTCVSSPKCVLCVSPNAFCVTKCVCWIRKQRSSLRLLTFARFARTFINNLN